MALSDLTQSLAADPTYGTSDPETIKRRQLMAAALINQGTSTEPIRSPWQGAANLAKALMGGADSAMADMAEQRGRKSVLPDLNTAIQPRAVTTPSQAMTTADATPGTNYRDAISSVESGGKYDAIGPDTGGDRAYGRYQVMGANIPAWTKAALGREMTPQEFLADPKAQDATFDHRFGQYVQQYGNPQDAASVWFSGRPMAKAGNASDVLGTTVPGYVAKFNAALGKPQGTQVASADTSFAPQSNQPDFSGAPMPPPRPDDVGMPNSVRPVAQFTNAPVADATDAADGEDKPAPAQVAQAAPAAAQSPMADPRVAAAYRVASNPWATPAQQQIAMTIIKDAMNPKEKYGDPYTDAQGNLVQRGPDGKINMLKAAKDDKETRPAPMGTDMYGRTIYGLPDGKGGWKPVQAGANSPATNSDEPPATGDEFLKTLDPKTAESVKAITEGRMSATGRQLQQLMPLAAQYDPTFNQQKYQERLTTQRSLASSTPGSFGGQLKAAEQATQHASRLFDRIDSLGNYTTLPGVMNPIHQMVGSQFDKNYQDNSARFLKDVDALTGELGKVFTGNAPALETLRHWRAGLDLNASPATLKAAVSEAMQLLHGGIESITSRVNQTMGTQKDPMEFLAPSAREAYGRIANYGLPQGGNAAAPNSAPAGGTPKRYRYDAQGNLTAQ